MAAVVKVAVCPTQAVKSVGWVVMVMLGVEPTVKTPLLVAVLPPTVTEIDPVVAPVGTVVVILVAELAVTNAVVPLNCTILLAGVVSKFVPVIVTDVPTRPLVGVKLVMVAMAGAHTVPDGVSPVIVHPFVVVKLALAATALVPYCLPVAPKVLPLGVDGLALHPSKMAE